MKKLSLYVAPILLMSATASFANTVDQRLNVGALSSTCSFANPVIGDATYEEPSNTFITTAGEQSKIDISFRNMSSLYIDNDNTVLEDGTNIGALINNIDYSGSVVSGDINSALIDYQGAGYTDASYVDLTSKDEGSITASLNTLLEMAGAFSPSQTAAYKTTYVLTCVE